MNESFNPKFAKISKIIVCTKRKKRTLLQSIHTLLSQAPHLQAEHAKLEDQHAAAAVEGAVHGEREAADQSAACAAS